MGELRIDVYALVFVTEGGKEVAGVYTDADEAASVIRQLRKYKAVGYLRPDVIDLEITVVDVTEAVRASVAAVA